MSGSVPSIAPRLALGVGFAACAVLFTTYVMSAAPRPAQPLKVAFIGDQGIKKSSRAVLRMIKEQGADMVLHQGDFDYRDKPGKWDAMITEVLGADFPYFASIGNHDVKAWSGPDGYQAKLRARLARIDGAACHGELGVRAACTYRGLFFILSGIGTLPKKVRDEPEHVAFIRDELAKSDAGWRICTWHRNQRAMQVGSKSSDVGWQAYEACREAGAIVATGHEHSYSRTHLMDNFERQSVASKSDTLVLERGKSFAFVSGLGGQGVRDQDRGGDWWASIYTEDQNATHGALFCTFNVGGDPTRATCRFRDINGNEPDRFEIVNAVDKPPRSGTHKGG